MQPTIERQITTTGNLGGKATAMSIAPEHMQHVMNVLTKMYSDPAMAVLREYSANGRDAMVMAGKGHLPIEVTLPDRFNNNLTIKDYGIGMSVDFVENRYSKYGDSDKRDSNKAIGGFGIGGKAALAYTDSFTLTTVQNHEKGIFVISRDAGGAGSIKTIAVMATDEDNYTEVKVPVRNYWDFTDKAEHLFSFWEKGTVLVNGEQPEIVEGDRINDSLMLTKSATPYVVMGGIPYRVERSKSGIPQNLSQFGYVARVGIEEMSITPSREDLEYNDLTLATLDRIATEFNNSVVAMIKAKITAHTDGVKAYNEWVLWNSFLRDELKDFVWNGVTMTGSIDIDGEVWRRGRNYGTSCSYEKKYQVQQLSRAFFVTGRSKEWTSYTKSRVNYYLSEHGYDPTVAIIVDKVPSTPFAIIRSASWEDIVACKPEKRPATERYYEILSDAGYFSDVTADDLSKMKNIVLITPMEARRHRNLRALNMGLTNFGTPATIVKLAANRHNKFKKDFGPVVSLEDFVRQAADVEANKIPESAWLVKGMSSSLISMVRTVKNEVIIDPRIKELFGAIDKHKSYSDKIGQIYNICSYAGVPFPKNEVDEDTSWLTTDYPLLKALYYGYLEGDMSHDFAIYLNAAYSARKDK